MILWLPRRHLEHFELSLEAELWQQQRYMHSFFCLLSLLLFLLLGSRRPNMFPSARNNVGAVGYRDGRGEMALTLLIH